MTLDEALELARRISRRYPDEQNTARELANFVEDVLGAQMPCGWPEPVASEAGVDWEIADMTADEAIAIGAALIRAGTAALSLPEGSSE